MEMGISSGDKLSTTGAKQSRKLGQKQFVYFILKGNLINCTSFESFIFRFLYAKPFHDNNSPNESIFATFSHPPQNMEAL